ncbi:MAG: nitroreductase, partial [Peptococcaceae bacterium]|nr:nitroreductase [Peptococcaceae bacterium]
KFSFTLQGDDVIASAGLGFYSKVDLGIVKYHFELGSGRKLWFR